MSPSQAIRPIPSERGYVNNGINGIYGYIPSWSWSDVITDHGVRGVFDGMGAVDGVESGRVPYRQGFSWQLQPVQSVCIPS